MKILISGGCRETIAHIAKTCPHLRRYMGWMNSPRHCYSIQTLRKIGCTSMCLDNAAYSNFCPDAYSRMLDKWADAPIPVEWVTIPDVVGNAALTNALFDKWQDRIFAFPRAYVAQDGVEDLELPWDDFKCLFIGGTTGWKLSQSAESVVKEGKRRGKVIHMGRVNSQKRMRYAFQLGCESVDGTGYSKYNKKELRKALEYVHFLHNELFLDYL